MRQLHNYTLPFSAFGTKSTCYARNSEIKTKWNVILWLFHSRMYRQMDGYEWMDVWVLNILIVKGYQFSHCYLFIYSTKPTFWHLTDQSLSLLNKEFFSNNENKCFNCFYKPPNLYSVYVYLVEHCHRPLRYFLPLAETTLCPSLDS